MHLNQLHQWLLVLAVSVVPFRGGMSEENHGTGTEDGPVLSIYDLDGMEKFLATLAKEPERAPGHEDKVKPFLEMCASFKEQLPNLSDDELEEHAARRIVAAIGAQLGNKEEGLKLRNGRIEGRSLEWRGGKLVAVLTPEEHTVVDKYIQKLRARRWWFLVHRDFPILLERFRSGQKNCKNGMISKEAPWSMPGIKHGCGTETLKKRALTKEELTELLRILGEPNALSVAKEFSEGCSDPAGWVRMDLGEDRFAIRFLLDPGKITVSTSPLNTGGYELSGEARKKIGDWSERMIGHDITTKSPTVKLEPKEAQNR